MAHPAFFNALDQAVKHVFQFTVLKKRNNSAFGFGRPKRRWAGVSYLGDGPVDFGNLVHHGVEVAIQSRKSVGGTEQHHHHPEQRLRLQDPSHVWSRLGEALSRTRRLTHLYPTFGAFPHPLVTEEPNEVADKIRLIKAVVMEEIL